MKKLSLTVFWCGQKNPASLAAKRWIKLNTNVYKSTGKLMEKYNVTDITKESGRGENKDPDEFGWTNGVLLKREVSVEVWKTGS
jgi:alpha,alpha-trehalase